jgi:hypothetical protein
MQNRTAAVYLRTSGDALPSLFFVFSCSIKCNLAVCIQARYLDQKWNRHRQTTAKQSIVSHFLSLGKARNYVLARVQHGKLKRALFFRSIDWLNSS